MEKSRSVSYLWFALISVLVVGVTQGLTLSSLERKGAIESLSVQPSSPNTGAPVVLHVTVADALELDRIETQRIGNTFMVKVYWTQPPAGSVGSDSGHGQKSLGMLPEGKYRLFVQSSCDRLLAGTKQFSFEVVEAPAPAGSHVIDELRVTPANPTTSDTIVAHVFGAWPTGGYTMPVSMTRLMGQTVYIDLYFNKPDEPVTMAVTPFHHEAPLQLTMPGTYTVRTRIYLDGELVDQTSISVQVAQGSGSNWPWNLFGLGLGRL
jgi:hypothetical protein